MTADGVSGPGRAGPLGGKEVLRGQLDQLLLIGKKRNVEIQVMPLDREDNAGVDGPFTVITRKGGEQFTYMEVQGQSSLLTNREEVRLAAARYGIIRSQALTPRETLGFIEKLLGALKTAETSVAAQELFWVTSSDSGAEGGQCVEVAITPGAVHIRDSKARSGPVLTATPPAWARLIRLATDQLA